MSAELMKAAAVLYRSAKRPAGQVLAVAREAADAFRGATNSAIQAKPGRDACYELRQQCELQRARLRQELAQRQAQGRSLREQAEHAYTFVNALRATARDALEGNGHGFLAAALAERHTRRGGDAFPAYLELARASLARRLERAPDEDDVYGVIIKSAARPRVWGRQFLSLKGGKPGE